MPWISICTDGHPKTNAFLLALLIKSIRAMVASLGVVDSVGSTLDDIKDLCDGFSVPEHEDKKTQ